MQSVLLQECDRLRNTFKFLLGNISTLKERSQLVDR